MEVSTDATSSCGSGLGCARILVLVVMGNWQGGYAQNAAHLLGCPWVGMGKGGHTK